MARPVKNQMQFQKAKISRNGQDPIFGGEGSKFDCNEEPIGTPDQQSQIVNSVSSSISSPLVTRKRKVSDSCEYDQGRRVSKKRFSEDGYPNISNGLRRLFLCNYFVFTNSDKTERKGSECDVSSLETVFTKFGYEIVTKENLSYEATFNELTNIQQVFNDGGTHMIVLVFMSHGDGRDPDNFLTSDGNSVSMSQVRNMFSNESCEGLRGKPKIFLGIFCRDILANHDDALPHSPAIGPERFQSDPHYLENNEAEYDPDIEKIVQMLTGFDDFKNIADDPTSMMEIDGKKSSNSSLVLEPDNLEDMATIYSSKPKAVSFRHHRKGTVMVQCFCQVLDECGKTHHLIDVFSLLQEEMKRRQTEAGWEYTFIPDLVDLEMKTCFFADI